MTAIPEGYTVTYDVDRNGPRRFEYRLDERYTNSNGVACGLWSYKPDGCAQWYAVNAPSIRHNLDQGLHPDDAQGRAIQR